MGTTNPHAMHTVLIWIEGEAHEMMETGECSGNVAERVKRFPIKIVGTSRDDAIRKMNTLIEEVKILCQNR